MATKKQRKLTNRLRPSIVADVVKIIDSCKTESQILGIKKFIENICERKREDAIYVAKHYSLKIKQIQK